MKAEHPVYLIWLNWPIAAFRLSAASLKAFKACLKPSDAPCAEVIAVRSERTFLCALPHSTHVICWSFKTEWFARAPRLRVLATPAAGRELVPSVAELPPGVVKVHGEFHGQIMSETVIAFMFARARGLYAAADFQRQGRLWPRSEMSPFCSLVSGTRAVILGYGRIGRVLGTKLTALGVQVTGVGRHNFSVLRPALRTADWLIVALPSDTGTDRLVDAALLRCLPRRAVLINIGRGNAVDEAALARALKAHRIAGACLDVFQREPLDATSPLAADLPGLVRLPHASAFAPDYLPLFFRELAEHGYLD